MNPDSGSKPTPRLGKGSQMQPVVVSVTEAEYVTDYKIRVVFSDQTEREIDFAKPFGKLKGYYAHYREMPSFRAFHVASGNLVWGEDWDVIFPVWSLYTGSVAR